ncbi:MAG: hypothetical protein ACOC7T_02990 [Planctomycetota bacterium]
MSEDEHKDLDRLVQRHLEREAAEVDIDAFMLELGERRARSAKSVWGRKLILAAAAACLMIAGVATLVLRPTTPPPRREPVETAAHPAELPSLQQWQRALRAEVVAALDGARTASSAAVAAGREPLKALAAAPSPSVRLPREAASLLPRLLGRASVTAEDLAETAVRKLDIDTKEEDR